MAHRQIEDEIAQLNLLSQAAPAEALPPLQKALTDRVNLIAAKAAKLAADLRLEALTPDLLRAFDRLFEKPAERDPQCWAKTAIAKALVVLNHRESAPFVRGIRHIQMEPVWGGEADTAPTLRGTCALALPSCSDLPRAQTLRHLVNGLTDAALPVRLDSVRAVAQMDGDEAVLLLRLKARAGDQESEVLGLIFDMLLQLEHDQALPFVADFLQPKLGVTAEEAALALGSARLPAAVSILQASCARERDPDFRIVLMRALSATREPRALAYLIDLVSDGREIEALHALEALSIHRESPEIRRQVEAAATERTGAVPAAFRQSFAGVQNV